MPSEEVFVMIRPIGALVILLAAQALAPGTDMVRVEGSSFIMGNPGEDGDADERPTHRVTLASFYIGRHEVTVGEFREFVEATGYRTTAELGMDTAMVYVGRRVEKRRDASWKNPYYEQDDRHPVVCVSWIDAVSYCNWRSAQDGLEPCYRGSGDSITCSFRASGYRLPTEAEWEYAARSGGRNVTYAWGEGAPYRDGKSAGNTRDEAAHPEWNLKNYWENYEDGYAYTAPACSFSPNELGICDMSGNVYEWCWDWYGEDYYAQSPVDNPTGPARGTVRSCRDAGFACPIEEERVFSRGLGKPTLAFSWGGFRVARSGDRSAREAGQSFLKIQQRIACCDYYTRKNKCPWTGAYIAANGDVIPCSIVADSDIVELGNVFEMNFTDTWNSPAYRELRRRIANDDFPPYCHTCYRMDD
jgi:sulfatase modifying factor 1